MKTMRKLTICISVLIAGALLMFAACVRDNSQEEGDDTLSQEENNSEIDNTLDSQEGNSPVPGNAPAPGEDSPIADGDGQEVVFFGIPIDPDMQKEIVRLVEGDKRCFFEIFILYVLDIDRSECIDDRYYKVDSDEFQTFADFEKYIRGIFCEKESDWLLFGKDDDRKVDPIYIELNGALYLDSTRVVGTGYYSTWPDYSLEIVNLSDDACEFKLHTTEDPPPEIGDPVPMVLDFKAINEGGQWRLEKLVYTNDSW